MGRIPSRCEKCVKECPSKQALLAYKAKMHPNKAPGPPLKQNKVKLKGNLKKLANGASNSTRTPVPSGSSGVMDNWMRGTTRSSGIGRAIARSREDDQPR